MAEHRRGSTPYVVGFQPHERGRDALNLAVAMARAFEAELHLVYVVRRHDEFAPAYPPVGRDEEIVAEQARGWLDAALAELPGDVPAQAHVRFAPSTARGLDAAAAEMGAALLIVGGARGGLRGRLSIGSVADSLLHHAAVPVALAPHGYDPDGRIDHVDAAVGNRPGAQSVVDEVVEAAVRARLPVRLVSLVDGPSTESDRRRESVTHHLSDLLAQATQRHGSPPQVDITVSVGRDLTEAVAAATWSPTSLLVVGSSRLARSNRLFLGSTAARILRTLAVPLVVVPRPGSDDE